MLFFISFALYITSLGGTWAIARTAPIPQIDQVTEVK